MTYTVIERKIKYPRLEFKKGELFAVVPRGRSYLADALVAKHEQWIIRAFQKHAQLLSTSNGLEFADRTQKELETVIQELMLKASVVLQVSARGVSYRAMIRRWGSCSMLGDLVFNKRLAVVPESLVWYVVFHEMCHLRVHAHNKLFNELMRTQFADIKYYKDMLKAYTHAISERK